MRKIRKHALAEGDLIDIWQYGFEEWGAQQADKYLDELDKNFALLCLPSIRRLAASAITCARATACCSSTATSFTTP